ncbi:phage tail tape measure protein [Escherichia coli]|uniref:phage tail tape measure protein n=3 Tax=Escherichia coli TaxID=562 RepID=UPI000DA507ED|nr:phage tail tape measure protein [Escherichia coli]EFH3103904.1 phage tail tape measure protein [Escherichia coli]EFL4154317.1 phage tail tape measure protein [Escherichia coli]EFO2279372.1 phage tail tape measure protein [Escherichia coli]EHD2952610.1 phage tail tape measure protein [Escherichia coli]EHP6048291.1 phage tail tape measure protein [Escherichia coli]
MSGQFSVGVVIGGMIGSTFRSAMSGTRRALDSLSDTSRRLQERQNALTRATERYGQLGSSRMQHLNSELLRVSRTMEQIERQQRRLSAASATSDALKANRMALYGQGIEAYGMAQTVYHTVSPAVQQSMSFQDKMIDMSITAKYDNKTRDALAGQIKGWALKYNQYQDELQEAVGSLISDNIDNLSDIGFLMPDIARAATATRTSSQDWAKVAAVWQNSLKGAARDFSAVQNIMAYAGDQGSFEIPDQVKWMQSLAPMMAGIASGKEAVAEIGASLQVAKIGAGSTDEAANNFKNFLTKIFARDTQKQFADLGIDLQGSVASYKAAGISPIEGMLSVIERYLNAKSPEALAGFKSAMKIKNDTARDEALQALAKNFGLGDMFADMQVMAFIRPMLANMDRYREIRAGALRAADNDLLASAYDQRLKSPLEATKALMVSSRDLAITLGDQLAPSFISLTQELIPVIQGAKHWVATHPQFVSGAFKLISALLAIKIATIGLKLGLNLLISPFVNVWKTAVLLRTNWLRLTLALGEGGKLRWLVTGFGAVARGVRTLGGVLSGGLVRGIMIAGRAVLWIGRALMMNPIGLVITAVAAAAYLIYRNWGAVSGWFKQRWADIQEAFNGGIAGTGKLLINWSPAGLLYKAFAAALKYFGVALPAKFTDFGGHLIDGLINGIKNKWGSLKSSVTGMGDSISSWFKQCWADIQEAFNGGIVGTGKLLINWSPAGLLYKAFAAALKYFGVALPAKFTDFGGHLVDGLINGIKNKWGSLKSSVTGMGDSISSWFKQCWADIQEAFNGGIVGTGKLLINWSPAGLLYKAFAAAMKYLGVDLPAKFTDFGGHLVDGLINGIKNKWESLKSSVTGMGDSISGWFSEKLGIHSPSRVFMVFGDNIAQGAAIGLQRTTPLAALAGQRMASELLPKMPVSIQGPEIRDNTSGVRFSMPLPDINGFMSSAKNAIGAVINSLSSMPAIPLSTRASILPGQRLANEMAPDIPRIPSPEILAAGYSGRGAAATGGGTSGGIQVSFNPQFFLNGRETTAPAGLTGALNMSLHELEKMLERLLAQKQRKEYR